MQEFSEPYDPETGDLTHLSQASVVHRGQVLGHISHLLVDPATNRAEWALVTDRAGTRRALPLDLLEDEDEHIRAVRGDVDVEHIRVGAWSVDRLQYLRTDVNAVVAGLRGAGFTDVRPVPWDVRLVTLDQKVSAAPEMGESSDLAQAAPPDAVPPQAVSLPAPPPPVGPSSAAPPPAPVAAEDVRREMVAELPKSVRRQRWIPVQVSIRQTSGAETLLGVPLDIPGGVTVSVVATVPDSFEIQGERVIDLAVPEFGDSPPGLFMMRAGAVGSFPVRFTAYRGGTFLGALELQIQVSALAFRSTATREVANALDVDEAAQEEASLQIMYDDASRTFRFLFITDSQRLEVPSRPIEGDIRDRVEALIPQFDAYASDAGSLTPEAARERMKNEGFRLWKFLVPPPIQRMILDNADTISQMTIFSDREVVPWELLYPLDENGVGFGHFLVEHFPVVRWVMKSRRGRRLTLERPTFVVPDGSPQEAESEIDDIALKLDQTAPNRVSNRDVLVSALAAPSFDCLHFACHNTYRAGQGSRIRFTDGDFQPQDLAIATVTCPLAATVPLVFLNACRTQGSAPSYTSLENWADVFLQAGAAAVIGTSWAVRDTTARLFAGTLYERLRAGLTLGESVSEARALARDNMPGDSTWLAYTVYGDPRAKVVQS
ncbi:CHAT domain-containing protein [Streptomyces sp. NPDC093094]|uniref:CHAT domain-containing protein n=1 Tax=Streptomyces sp. NPDC093094 TaxID=3366026 RepID=UPI0037FB8FAE